MTNEWRSGTRRDFGWRWAKCREWGQRHEVCIFLNDQMQSNLIQGTTFSEGEKSHDERATKPEAKASPLFIIIIIIFWRFILRFFFIFRLFFQRQRLKQFIKWWGNNGSSRFLAFSFNLTKIFLVVKKVRKVVPSETDAAAILEIK